MAITRRDLLHGASVLGLTVLPGLSCASDTDPAAGEPGTSSDVPSPSSRRSRAVFQHGVASGDPLSDAVILWTRVTPEGVVTPRVPVTWQIARDVGFTRVVGSGVVTTGAERDHTVKIDARGLDAGTTYYYRFIALGGSSPIGRTRTAPRAGRAHQNP